MNGKLLKLLKYKVEMTCALYVLLSLWPVANIGLIRGGRFVFSFCLFDNNNIRGLLHIIQNERVRIEF